MATFVSSKRKKSGKNYLGGKNRLPMNAKCVLIFFAVTDATMAYDRYTRQNTR